MPGWGLSFGIMLTMLSLVVLTPMAVLLWRGFVGFGAAEMWAVINRPRVWNALELSFRAALIASLFNLVVGVLLAWVLVRYRFPGRRIVDGIAFRQAERLGAARPRQLKLAYRLGVNDYAGVRSVQLVVEYLEPA